MAEPETNCAEVLASLSTYLDGEMVDCDGIERHLDACGDCVSHADFERHLKEVVRKACGEAELPPGLEAKIRSLMD
jgi:anti-sigma factor (TIGR02949 family)